METIKLDPKEVDRAFELSRHQSDVIIWLYQMVFPDWDKIKKVKGFPKINKNTNHKLFSRMIKFDKKHHPNVMPGGIWMNNGFSSLEGDHLEDWEVEPCEVEDL